MLRNVRTGLAVEGAEIMRFLEPELSSYLMPI